ncbi:MULTISPECIES: glycosyltransferase [unclassified Caballeronia]|uniref:glycosyltransferase family 2 protein n=1 Tax=unclassified Caballeronia TaxID=2646786 RepID=UPI00202984D5|nr:MULTISPECIES: glycosyltransferase [unclassified Caballeronia]
MASFDITAVINGHGEGLLAHASLRSLVRSADAARERGHSVELLAVLDRPSPLTREVFEHFARTCPELRIEVVQHGDLGYARNSAITLANGEYVAFLDADDIWGESWLTLALEAARADSRNIAWHPEVNVYFGVAPHLFLHMDMEDPRFRVATLAHTNAWTSLCFSSVAFLRQVPYAGTHLKDHIGYEDWSFNVDVIRQGGIHKIVPGTAHAIRTRHTSLVKATSAAGCIPRPSGFLRDVLRQRAKAADARRSNEALASD